MNSIGIDTTQNVSLNYTLAGIGNRIGAYLIDYLIMLAFIILMIIIGTNLFPFAGMGFYVLIILVGWLYFLVSEITMNGQTIGKKALNIKVVKLDGSKPTVGAYLLRWVAFPLDFGFSGGVAILTIVLTEKGQRLGDLLAGTTVVKLKGSSVHQLHKKRTLVKIEEGYEPVYTQAELITDEEISLMDKAIKAFNNGGARGPMETLYVKIKEKYQIESKDMPIRFFNTLQKDHAFYEREKEATLDE